MALTIKHLNSDASFLLSFKPILPFPPSPDQTSNTFTILLDPWISGPSTIFHPIFSISRHNTPSCIKSLCELTPEPDIVVISQNKSDHCHRQTLTQLPGHGGKTIILAEPAAAKTIRGWKHFAEDKVLTLPKWEDSSPETLHRIPIPALTPHGTMGEVTVAYLPQKSDLTGLHSAIGITYLPPTSGHNSLPLTPPSSPSSPTFTPSQTCKRALSLIFSPHGCTYKTLSSYTSTHLLSTAALPLTALLHCFDRIDNPWYLGGNICAGFPGGLEIAQKLCPRAWISAHDGDKETTGLGSASISVRKYGREEVESVVSPLSEKFPEKRTGIEAVVLGVGEVMTLTKAMDFWGGGK